MLMRRDIFADIDAALRYATDYATYAMPADARCRHAAVTLIIFSPYAAALFPALMFSRRYTPSYKDAVDAFVMFDAAAADFAASSMLTPPDVSCCVTRLFTPFSAGRYFDTPMMLERRRYYAYADGFAAACDAAAS